jgi:hypothetical protein
MRKRMIIRAVVAVLSMSIFLVGRPAAGFAHAGVARTPIAGRPAATPTTYLAVLTFKNRITQGCLADSTTGLWTYPCGDSSFPIFTKWGFTVDGYDSQGNLIGTLQNQATGSCLDDSAAYGLRGYFCDVNHDSLRIFQQFKLTPGSDGNVLQNMATGSCVDDSAAYGLRGYFCNGTYFQDWTEYQVG